MQKGFSLVEIMMVIAILGVLAAIAIPSYGNYIVKVKRSEMKTEMLAIAQNLQRYQIANKSFVNARGNLGFNSPRKFPDKDSVYNIDLTVSADNRTWILVAQPIEGTSQAKDGSIRLNSQGHKCWTKGQSCTLSASSKWDD